ncbi:MAG TPA: DUF2786 domain-containing protein [Dehalococcoidia bacterium]|jgi:hypothetical protein|nr:DUF2786 domain-containing protein [Dehalococcoidia bacterium]
MDDHKKILSRVQKMLNLANNAGATEGERDNAMRMAHATLAKYNLDLADLESANTEAKRESSGEPREEHTTHFYGRPWARNVCMNVGRLFFCHYIYMSHKKATNVKHYFIGRHSNAITAALMAEFIVKSIIKEGNRQKRDEMEGNSWLRTFCWGAANRIKERVEELIAGTDESQKAAEPGTGLVLASYYNTEREKNAVMLRQLHPALRTGRGGKGHQGGDAYSRGKQYGGRVSLNTQIQ